MDDLIYDRTRYDVENAIKNPSSNSSLKGAYNYTDLNRVEEWCEYLKNILKNYGFEKALDLKKDWNIRDYPTRQQMDRIRSNIKTLRNYCYSLVTEEIIYNNTLNYEQANLLEKILFDIDEHIKQMKITIELPYNIGAFLVRKTYINMEVNTDTLIEEHKANLNIDVAATSIHKKYITLKGVE